jgi:hypothetical protein
LLCRVILMLEVSRSFYWYVDSAGFWLGLVVFEVSI